MTPIWKMSCDKCTFLAHDPVHRTDVYLNAVFEPACLLVKYGDHDIDYDFHVFDIRRPTPPTPDAPVSVQAAWTLFLSNHQV